MTPKILLRIAAGLLLFFAVGHSIGHFRRHDVTDPKAIEVQRQMIENKFDMFGKLRSYDENYTGMSTNLILTLVTFTVLLWLFSSVVETNKSLGRILLLPIALCVVGISITGSLYFFPVPALTCLIASVIIFITWFKLK
jgi:hypothetical protein